jgi:hypothetical protein
MAPAQESEVPRADAEAGLIPGKQTADRVGEPGPALRYPGLLLDYRLHFALAALIYLAPIWVFRWLPMTDLPLHLGLLRILRDFGAAGTGYPDVYRLQLYPAHNVLHLLWCYLVGALTGPDIANRLFLSVYAVLLPLGLQRLIRATGGERWVGLTGFAFIYNFNFFRGDVSLLMAIPPALLALALLVEAPDRPGLRRPMLIALLLVVIFLGHALVYLLVTILMAALLAGQGAVARGRRTAGTAGSDLRPVGRIVAAQVPVLLILVLPWLFRVFAGEGGNLLSELVNGYSLNEVLRRVPRFLYAIGPRIDEVSIFTWKLLLVMVATGITVFGLRRGFQALTAGRLRAVTLLLATAAACYLLLPAGVRQHWRLAERLAVFVPVLMCLMLAGLVRAAGFRSRWAAAALGIVLLLGAANVAYRFAAFDREARPGARLLQSLPGDRKVLGLMYDDRMNPDLLGYDLFRHFASYYPAMRGGYAGYSRAASRYSPIIYRGENDFLPARFQWTPWSSVFPVGWQIYDYFLVRGRVRQADRAHLSLLRLVGDQGGWSLYSRE